MTKRILSLLLLPLFLGSVANAKTSVMRKPASAATLIPIETRLARQSLKTIHAEVLPTPAGPDGPQSALVRVKGELDGSCDGAHYAFQLKRSSRSERDHVVEVEIYSIDDGSSSGLRSCSNQAQPFSIQFEISGVPRGGVHPGMQKVTVQAHLGYQGAGEEVSLGTANLFTGEPETGFSAGN